MLVAHLLALASYVLASTSKVQDYGRRSEFQVGDAIPVLPANGGSSELPSPPQGVILKHIALGFGVQNYSCADVNAIPSAAGALAVLYDVTWLYPDQEGSPLTHEEWTSLPPHILDTGKAPLNRDSSGNICLTHPFPKKGSLKVEGFRKRLPYLGQHFFNAAGVPTFDLDTYSRLLIARKVYGIEAPASSSAGPDGTGAVDWLYLEDAGGSIGVSIVYRVLTAGGVSHGCGAKGSDSTSYAALYWFYG
ncbi:uncharacterized protein FIESC28_05776 [Fusarium coffeatum]|uniref:Malate dehydrogenase n=1 Tax=Fusarium coffeatum TaxID=231269 RepID=A0A366RPB8_9HYPO|nr:uncharacterized protein FIESC28_05776 [Fusarium coffeatum]RBR18954.1 hypothetical protein FIESC28_05776 [Fusarium coffeatum]